MKYNKSIRYCRLLCGALVMFALNGCAKSDVDDLANPTPAPEHKQEIVIHAVESSESRAIHGTEDDKTSFSWQADVDKIGILLGYEDSFESWWATDHYRFKNTTDGAKAIFVYDADPDSYLELPELQPGQTIVAYYPYGSAVSSWYDNTKPYLRSSLSALLQRGDNNTEHLYHGDYMYSRTITLKESHFDSEGNLKLEMEFGHIFAKMRFTIRNSTERTLDINSLVYRSTKDDDIMQGTLCMDATTGQLDLDNKGDWGGVPPSSSAVLEVEDVSLEPGQTATLWMWMMPLDFTEGNEDGRKADIMVNTSAGVFRVQNTNFNTKMVPGCVYRQGFELTEKKLLSDFAYIADPNFATLLFFGNMDGENYDEEGNFIGGSYCTLYDLELQPYEEFNGENWDQMFTTGCYIKISECANLEYMNVAPQMVNALSLDGLQYFTGLKALDINLGMDTDPAMSLRALKFGTLTNLESLNIMMTRAPILDFSANTKLQSLSINDAPMLEKIIGLDKLVNLESFGIGNVMGGMELDLSVCPSLKSLSINTWNKKMGSLNLSNLTLDKLTIDMPDMSTLISNNLSCKVLENYGPAFPSGAPLGVKELYLWPPYNVASMCTQFDQMTEIESLHIYGNFTDLVFTPAQASVKELEIYCSEGTNLPSGWSNLTGTESLIINKGSSRGEWCFQELDLSGMTSLKTAAILTNEIESFKAPDSLTDLDLTIQNSISFNPPAALVNLAINSVRGSVTVGDGAGIKSLYLIGEAGQNQPAITLGSYPLLESLIADTGSYGVITWGADSYPALKSYRLSYGSRVTSIPPASVLPKLEELYLSSNTGIRGLNMVEYTNLKILSLYESNFGSGSVVISQTQCDYAQTNGANEVYTGITTESVSSIYKVE